MCIVACASMFSFCSNDEIYTDSANKYQTENSSAELRPIIPSDPNLVTGNITGSYYPDIPADVRATNSKGVHYYGMVYRSGQFEISDLAIGTYTVMILPKKPSPLNPIIVPNVFVRANQTTDLGSLSFYVEQ